MDEKILNDRLYRVFRILASRDPKFPEENFFEAFVDYIRNQQARAGLPHTNDDIWPALIKVVSGFLMVTEFSWPEIVGSWYAEEVFEALKMHAERKNRLH